MKVYTQVGNTPYVLGSDELWTANLESGKDFSEKEARAVVADFEALDQKSKYWYK